MIDTTENNEQQTAAIDCIAVAWRYMTLTNSVEFLHDTISGDKSRRNMLLNRGGVKMFDSVLLHVLEDMSELESVVQCIPDADIERMPLSKLELRQGLEDASTRVKALLVFFESYGGEDRDTVPDNHIPFISYAIAQILVALRCAVDGLFKGGHIEQN